MILPDLNGQKTTEEIITDAARLGVEAEVARGLLTQLESASFIEETAEPLLDQAAVERYEEQLSFFSRFTSEGGAKLQARLRDSRVAVIGSDALALAVTRHLLASGTGEVVVLDDEADAAATRIEANVPAAHREERTLRAVTLDRKAVWPVDGGEPVDLVVYPQAAHDPALADALDTFSKQHGVPWMLIRTIDPHEGWVGPLFLPGDTASYLSLEARLRGNLPFFEEYLAFDKHLRAKGRPSAPSGGLHAYLEVLSGVAVSEIVKHLSGFAIPTLAGKFLTLNLMTWEAEIHEVLRLPHVEVDSTSQPRVYPWKEIPYDEQPKSRRG
ncbi:MAG: hypothetical protein AAGD38_14355 [Acidobacteriota bacterium]